MRVFKTRYLYRECRRPGRLSRYSDSLRAGWSGDRIPVGGEIFRTLLDRPWGPPSLLYNGYRIFPGGKSGRGVVLTTHPHLRCPGLKKGRAIPLPTLRVLVAYTGRTFTFTGNATRTGFNSLRYIRHGNQKDNIMWQILIKCSSNASNA